MRTTRSRIRGELRRLFVKSTERAEAMKRDKYTCQVCNKKQSKKKGFEVKVEVHHLKPIDWDLLIDEIQDKLLCDSNQLQVLCVDCHKAETYKEHENTTS
jgi:5-methylcytosine-specific restriction endonuclease McrA